MNAENLVSKVWNFCHMLRDELPVIIQLVAWS